MSRPEAETARPYLVIPKLIEQPTWGGDYIVKRKEWDGITELASRKFGQSYELFSGSNLSLLEDSSDEEFRGEVTDNKAVTIPTQPASSISLARLTEQSPAAVLGEERARQMGGRVNLLMKFTQALGNSFQVHIKDGVHDNHWRPKPESWYYFEPGFITLGARENIDWEEYQRVAITLDNKTAALGDKVKAGDLLFEEAQAQIKKLVEEYDPWQYVNLHYPQKDEIIDLSTGGTHHSWEEDSNRFPLGNVLYEVQLEAMDDVSTMRVFDKGKMSSDGSTRSLNIEDYFRLVDRSPEANNPASYAVSPNRITENDVCVLDRIVETKYYTMNRLSLAGVGTTYVERIEAFRHVFVKAGHVEIVTPAGTIRVGQGHSCFIPAAAREYEIKNSSDQSETLVSY